jgi:hypothetical protein
MEQRGAQRGADLRPLRAAMDRMHKPLRSVRDEFATRTQRGGGLYGLVWWRNVGTAKVGGFFGFITDPRGWEHLEPAPVPPEAIVFAFVRPADHPLHRRLVARKGSLFEKVARDSRSEAVPFDLYRDRAEALVRHRTMRGRPDEILVLTSCDFFSSARRAFFASDFLTEIRKLRPAEP